MGGETTPKLTWLAPALRMRETRRRLVVPRTMESSMRITRLPLTSSSRAVSLTDTARSRMAFSDSRPSRRIGTITLPSTLNSGSRKWNWKTKPIFLSRVSARPLSSSAVVSSPSSRILPLVGWSSRPSR